MLHLNPFAAQDASDFREPPNEAPIGRLRQRRPPQRSTAENEARQEVAGEKTDPSRSCILYGLLP